MKHTSDITDDFFPRLKEVALELGADPHHMMAVMFSESACKADAWNDNPKSLPTDKRWNASGLIQFMPATLMGLGYTAGHTAFRRLTATAQLEWVKRYYSPYRGHLGDIAGLYLATFLPALVRHAGNPDFILTAKGGPLGWAYGPNSAFDKNGDQAISVRELEDAVQRNAQGPRWAELVARLDGDPMGDQTHHHLKLGTISGLQEALTVLGHDPGPIDGIAGPRTTSALQAFQLISGLVPDGIYGPLSRAALEAACSGLRTTK